MITRSKILLGMLALSTTLATPAARAEGISAVGVSVGSLGNPYFVALVKGATTQLKTTAPSASINALSADYDLNKQFSQMDSFVASGVNLILLNGVDPQAVMPAIKRVQKSGATVIAVDVGSAGVDGTVQTDNVAAGRISCEYLAKKLDGKGEVAIENGPQVSSIIDRVKGCKEVLSGYPGIKIVSDDQNGGAERDLGFKVMQGFLVRFPNLKGVFAINDPEAIGGDLAIRQARRQGITVTSVDGAPDIVSSLKDPKSSIVASASQDPYQMGKDGIAMGQAIKDGKVAKGTVRLMAPTLITRDNVGSYKGWTGE
ncbi:ABC transporter substrate-binding protein [Asaia siamensis]